MMKKCSLSAARNWTLALRHMLFVDLRTRFSTNSKGHEEGRYVGRASIFTMM